MWTDDTVSQVLCIGINLKQCAMKVCVIEHPAVVLDAGYELNEDPGPGKHDIQYRSDARYTAINAFVSSTKRIRLQH